LTNDALNAFADVIGEEDQTVLLLDHRGKVVAGMYVDSSGSDVSQEIGLALGGVGTEATRAMRHLELGEWRAIVCECSEANLALAPVDDGGIVLVAAAPEVPHGFVRRMADVAARRAFAWRREVA
jgi:predicted regulator of Ras-like GTPase activity (Roadblock/LC7/MglB family)